MTPARKTIYWLIEMIFSLLMITWLIETIGTRPDGFVTDTVIPFSEIFQIQPSIMAAILMSVLVVYMFMLFLEGVRGVFLAHLDNADRKLAQELMELIQHDHN